jgi:hypothetical protein
MPFSSVARLWAHVSGLHFLEWRPARRDLRPLLSHEAAVS